MLMSNILNLYFFENLSKYFHYCLFLKILQCLTLSFFLLTTRFNLSSLLEHQKLQFFSILIYLLCPIFENVEFFLSFLMSGFLSCSWLCCELLFWRIYNVRLLISSATVSMREKAEQ
jgi:hypothetical protein